jgi:hypothetical protein
MHADRPTVRPEGDAHELVDAQTHGFAEPPDARTPMLVSLASILVNYVLNWSLVRSVVRTWPQREWYEKFGSVRPWGNAVP